MTEGEQVLTEILRQIDLAKITHRVVVQDVCPGKHDSHDILIGFREFEMLAAWAVADHGRLALLDMHRCVRFHMRGVIVI